MVKEIYTHKHNIEYYDVDQHKRLKLQNLLDIINNASFLESEQRGCSLEFLAERNLTWVFCKMELVIKKAPTFQEKIYVKTFPIGSKRYFASRKFEVFDESGEEIAYAYGLYFLIETEKRKPVKIPADIMEYYGEGFETDMICLKDLKILPVEAPKMEKGSKVRYSDIDTNGHVNNAVYPLWAIETLPLEYLDNYQLKKLKVIFEKEVFLDNSIKVATDFNQESKKLTASHTIYNEDNDVVCLLNSHWEKINN